MAVEVYSFPVTIPAATAKAAGFVASLAMPDRIVEELEVLIPPGPSGLVGFAIGAAGQPILPLTRGQWIVTDDEVVHWPLQGQISSGAWELFGYNLGTFDHTVTVRFLTNLPTAAAAGAGLPNPIDALALSGG